MAFIGKKQNAGSGSKQPDYQLSINDNRIGLVFRNGVVPPGSKIDVLVGTEEDYGYLKIVPGTKEVRAIGKKGLVTSWSAVRAAVKDYPNLHKHTNITGSSEDGEILLDLGFDHEVTEAEAADLGL